MQQKLMDRYVDRPVKWAAIAGFLLVILGAFGPWVVVDTPLGDASNGGFDENGVLTFILALIGLAAIAAYAFSDIRIESQLLHWGLVAIAVLIAILVLIDFLDVITEDAPEGFDIGPGWGLWLSLVGAILALVGTIVPMWDEIQNRTQGMRNP